MNDIESHVADDDEGEFDENYAPRLAVTRRRVPNEWDEATSQEAILYRLFGIG